MTKDTPIDQHVLAMNALANRCFGEDNPAWERGWSAGPNPRATPLSWVIVDPAPPALSTRIARFKAGHEPSTRGVVEDEPTSLDPARVAFEILSGSKELRHRDYIDRQIRLAVSEAIAEHVETLTEGHNQARQRARTMVRDLVAQLREKVDDEAAVPVPAEAWRMVDFTALDDDEE
jgi:hypothetical protein